IYSNVRWHALQIAGGVQELKALYYRQFILTIACFMFPVPCAQRYTPCTSSARNMLYFSLAPVGAISSGMLRKRVSPLLPNL
nr:hypothetical protein [Microcoleaceae cyanobacterium MO_207.B10]